MLAVKFLCGPSTFRHVFLNFDVYQGSLHCKHLPHLITSSLLRHSMCPVTHTVVAIFTLEVFCSFLYFVIKSFYTTLKNHCFPIFESSASFVFSFIAPGRNQEVIIPWQIWFKPYEYTSSFQWIYVAARFPCWGRVTTGWAYMDPTDGCFHLLIPKFMPVLVPTGEF